MAIASTPTKLSLDRFAQRIGIHPLHFNQVQLDENDGMCAYPVLQYAWQAADRTSRESIAEAIAQAEARVEMYLGYPLAGSWIANEEYAIPRWHGGLQLRSKYVQYGGTRAQSLISAGATITYSDVDSDGYKETATITFLTSVTDANEIAVFYPGHLGDEAFQIKNLNITLELNTGTATVKFRREQCLKENYLLALTNVASQQGNSDANFLSTVDVYRIYNDPTTQVQLITYDGCANCSSAGCQACAHGVQNACLSVTDSRNGIIAITPGEYNSTTGNYNSVFMCATPIRLKVSYFSGRGYNGNVMRMPDEWERAISYYALSLLDRPLCRCTHLAGIQDQWKEDLLKLESSRSSGSQINIVKTCPLGTTRAALNAWRKVQDDCVTGAAIHA